MQFNIHIKKYSKYYWGVSFDWKWFRAQAIAESGLNPDAVSPVGAKGIMQIMPATWREIRSRIPWLGHIDEPRWNIAAGIYYARRMYRIWTSPRPFLDKMAFTFASYNAGAGTIIRAQKHCGGCTRWCDLIKHAATVPHWRHEETLGYVRRIFKLMGINIC